MTTQRDYLQSLDATIVGAMQPIGMADVACWQAKRGRQVDGIHVLVDRGVELVGADGGVTTNSVIITLFRADTGGGEAEGDLITIGTERWRIRQVLDRDESQARCAVVAA